MSRESKILIAILVLVVGSLIGVFILANQGAEGPKPVGDKSKITRDNSHKEGSGSVQLVEFGDSTRVTSESPERMSFHTPDTLTSSTPRLSRD